MTELDDLTINLNYLDTVVVQDHPHFVEDFKKHILEHMQWIYQEVTNDAFLPEQPRPFHIIDDESQSEFTRIFAKWVGHFKKEAKKDD